ncbi:MAG: tetratricopeptide repeat protein [Isosphaeraceae bacterium]|nr:tetratricopeptide repeat protein [Isosphaeraceae bacterium]
MNPPGSSREPHPRLGVGSSPSAFDIDTLVVDLEKRWSSGQRPSVEMYRDQFEIGDPTFLRELIYAEYHAARRAGTPIPPESYTSRFPNLRDTLTNLFELDRELELESDDVDLAFDRFPRPGDHLGQYFLETTLGQGSFARVFLARDRQLESRKLVVKISRGPSVEKQMLARLEHPNLMPILDYRESNDGSFQVICMPYRGRLTLKSLIEGLGDPRTGVTRGRQVVDIIRSAADRGVHFSFTRLELSELDRSRAMIWIIARIAEALAFVHERGTVHNDVKPSNILIAEDGTPLLFDFNVAADRASLDQQGASVGGTYAYLPPERILEVLGKQPAADDSFAAGVRSDLYALALVLLECLTGRATRFEPDPLMGARAALGDLAEERSQGADAFRGSLRLVKSEIRPVLEKALEADPAKRYPTAAAFAEDLNRILENRPPRHVFTWPDPRRFARRNRRAVSVGGVAVLLVVIGLGVGGGILRNESRTLLESMLDDSGFAAASIGPPLTTARPLLQRLTLCGEIETGDLSNWRRTIRYRLLGTQERAALDALYFGTIQSWCRLFGTQSEQKRQLALRWLDLAISVEPVESLVELRSELASDGDGAKTTVAPERGWLHDYLRGLERFRLHARESLDSFDRVLAVHPELVTARLARAAAAQRLGMGERAIDDLRGCVQDHPKALEFRLRLAQALSTAGRLEEARAVLVGIPHERLDVRTVLTKAAQGRAEELSAILTEYIDLAADNVDPASRLQLLRKLQVIASRDENGDSDLESRLEAVRVVRRDLPDRLLVAYRTYFAMKEAVLLERLERFEEAAGLYSEVLATDPDHLFARYSLGQLQIRKLRRPNEGIANSRTVIEDPRFEEMVAFDPRLISVAFLYIDRSLRTGDPWAALAAASRAVEVSHLQSVSRAEAHGWLATALSMIHREYPELSAIGAATIEMSAACHFRRPGDRPAPVDSHHLALDQCTP